ncbi:MAG: BtpA/SgcQ family protein [Deltaproteobacteria bacterium]|nr:BtpA/SgcQ family protein [Deltaproteobacteria bacterium]
MLRGLIGVVHLPPLPGDPRHPGGGDFGTVEAWALADAEALAAGGADAIVVENFGSAPFPKGTAGQRLPPHQVATLALIARELRRRFGLPVGVNCLRNDAISAVGLAAAAGLDFARVNVHVGAYLTDQGILEGEAYETLRYRKTLGAERVALLADVLVKHAVPLAPLDPASVVRDTFERGLADGVVVTGAATGAAVNRERLELVRRIAGDRPVYLGSGLTPELAPTLCPLVEGAIVGTWLKEGGEVRAPVDPDRVRTLSEAVRGRFRTSAAG